MRISCTYKDNEKVWETSETEVIFGRAEGDSSIVLDLNPDARVSRLHGRIWMEDGQYWIEDLHSTRGTQLNGAEIKDLGRQPIKSGDTVVAGQTMMRVEPGEPREAKGTNYLELGTLILPEKNHAMSGVAIAKDVDATAIEMVPLEGSEDSAAKRFKMVCDLPFQFATKTTLETLLPSIVDHLLELIPTGESWALVLLDPTTDALLLKAYHYARCTYLSETLLRRAMRDRKAFIWKRDGETDLTGSIVQCGIETGMYVPLVWQGESLGAICAGARNADSIFSDDDVRLLVLVAQYAAMAVATHRLQEKLRRESMVKANLLRQFSPKVADQLLSHRGRLRLGGQRNPVTILNADIRFFTQLAHELEPDSVVEMLNDYLAVAVPIIFKHRGTIDKFIGDAILAVFGSPEPDPAQHENAVRAAMEMQEAVTKLNEARALRGDPCRDFGIGVHCGEVVHGFVGTADRMEFTVIGDAVNRAARYCAAAAERQVLISPEIHEHVWRCVETEPARITTKHEGDLVAYLVKSIKEKAEASGATPSESTPSS